MIALEHMQTNALLVVLFGAFLALVTLRVAVHLSHRARTLRDRAIVESSRTVTPLVGARETPVPSLTESSPHLESSHVATQTAAPPHAGEVQRTATPLCSPAHSDFAHADFVVEGAHSAHSNSLR
jgi:hypothetical protein